MNTFRFLDFEVYKLAKALHQEVIKLTKHFPRECNSLADQIFRSSLSVVLNIAEGSAKRSDKDFNRFIETALGSVSETVAGLDVVRDHELIDEVKFNELMKLSESIAKQLGGLSKKLKSDFTKS